MRLVDRKTFLAMPGGTVYAKVPKKWIVDDLSVKYKSTDYNDWYYTSFSWVAAKDSGEAVDRLELMDANPKTSFPVEDAISRDGLFEETDKFLIYEAADIDLIISKLRGKS